LTKEKICLCGVALKFNSVRAKKGIVYSFAPGTSLRDYYKVVERQFEMPQS